TEAPETTEVTEPETTEAPETTEVTEPATTETTEPATTETTEPATTETTEPETTETTEPETTEETEPDPVEVGLDEAVTLEDGTKVIVKGTVKEINTPWSDQYNNITVTIEDEKGNTLYIYRLATNVEIGDIVTITGKIGSYNGAKQIAAGATAEITGHVEETTETTEPATTETTEPATTETTEPATTETTEPVTTEKVEQTTEKPVEEPKGGCGSVAGFGAMAIVAVAAVALVSFKKKED
ncbi:MAG: hypothetical protein IJC64_02595, partial [Clostridia bacterium]|nr:hypothetical protein [Clostridia bacterium]